MRGTVAMLSAWSFASVRDYSNMLAQMAVAEQQYFDKSLAQAQKAAVEAQKLRDQARQDKYEADTAGNQNGMGDSSGGDMGSSSSSTSIVHRSAGMTPQTVGTAIKLKLGR